MKRGKEQGMTKQNPLQRIQANFKEVESNFRGWLAKQSLPVETAVAIAAGSAQGALYGAYFVSIHHDDADPTPPLAMASPLKQTQGFYSGGPLIQVRKFAVILGVSEGISCVMKRIRGKEDVQSSMVLGFGSGATISLVHTGMSGSNHIMDAAKFGLFLALLYGGLFQATSQFNQKFSQPPPDVVYYSKTRSLLSILGLQKYEKNFKEHEFTDGTLPFLTYSAVRELEIPVGHRLFTLGHNIQRDRTRS